MSQIERREYFIEDPLSPKLFMQSWKDATLDSCGTVLITHGMAEHSECYDHVAQSLARQGWFVFAWDLQGHGKSQGKRGYIKDFKEFPRDLKIVIDKIKEDGQIKSSPFVLVGHSMGGLITLSALINNSLTQISATVLSSPALGLSVEVPKIKDMASHWLKTLWPTLTLDNEINYNNLSRDKEMVESYSKDPLRHTKVSAPLYLGMVAEMKEVISKSDQLKGPIYFQIAGKDQVTSTQASLDLFKSLDVEKKLSLYEDSYHEIYNDINRQETVDDLISFLGELKS